MITEEYYILYFDNDSPTLWKKVGKIWFCKSKGSAKESWFIIDNRLYDAYIPEMIKKFGQKLF